MGFDLDVSGGHKGHSNRGDNEPEGEREKGLLVGEHVQEWGKPGIKLVKRLYSPFLFPGKWNEMMKMIQFMVLNEQTLKVPPRSKI